jgi:ubiquinone/menaquinone biosynthesis C-methylase UbiE
MTHDQPRSGTMDRSILQKHDDAGSTNWWVLGRSRLFRKVFGASLNTERLDVLEIGPGAGSNLSIWDRNFSSVVIADADVSALRLSLGHNPNGAVLLDASSLPFRDEAFDHVLLGDVIEHLVNDLDAMKEVCRVLKPTGLAVVTVPAYQFLWGEQDRLAGHQRRYRLRGLRQVLLAAGFHIRHIGYFNWILFPFAAIFKLVMRFLRPRTYSDATSIPSVLNYILKIVFRADVAIARRVSIPFGISILAVVTKQRLHATDQSIGKHKSKTEGHEPKV